MTRPENPQNGISPHQVLYTVSTVCLIGLTLDLGRRLLPWLQVAVPLLLGWWLWRRFRSIQRSQQKTLSTIFYQLLQEHGGRITVLDFALMAHLPAIAARHYLDDRAKDFFAHFEVTEQGDVIYIFPTLKSPQLLALNQTVTDPSQAVVSTSKPGCEASVCRPLTQKKLAKRLGVSVTTLRRKQFASGLTEWTQSLDPEGIGWSYLAQARRFFPMRD